MSDLPLAIASAVTMVAALVSLAYMWLHRPEELR